MEMIRTNFQNNLVILLTKRKLHFAGIYVEVETPFSYMGTETIIQRIVENRQLYEARNRRKQEKAALEEKMLASEKAAKVAK